MASEGEISQPAKRNVIGESSVEGLGLTVITIVFVVALWISIRGNLPQLHWYDWFFIAGTLGCVWAQTTVAAFFRISGLYNDIKIPGEGFIVHGSSYLFSILAFIALHWIDNFKVHVSFSLLFFVWALVLDLWVAFGLNDDDKRRHNGKSLVRMCLSLAIKVDGISLIGLSALWLLATFNIAGTDLSTPLFLSGAFGFHFFVMSWLLLALLNDWQSELSEQGFHHEK